MSQEFGKALAQKIATKLPREKLEAHLAKRLKEVKMCTLVTSNGDMPRGTPLEFFADGLEIFIGPDPGTKTKNLSVNPNVTVSIYNNLAPDWETEWDRVWGIQVTGLGTLYENGTPEHSRGREVIDFAGYYRSLGRGYTQYPLDRKVLKVVPKKIELVDFALIGEGFCHRQVWTAGKA